MLSLENEINTLNVPEDLIESSFTKKQPLNSRQRLFFNLAYKYYALRSSLIVKKDFLSLLMTQPSIVSIQFNARKDGGLAKRGQWMRLLEMARFIKEFNPPSICELGSGTSSALLAKICPGKVTVFEESQYWMDRTLTTMGELAKKITMVRAQRIVQTKDDEGVSYYDMDHAKYYDFVYVDGPTTEPPDGAHDLKIKDPVGYLPNIDVELFWENKMFPRVILIDCRRATVRRLVSKGRKYYNIYLKSDLLMNTHMPIFSKHLFHTVLIRKDGIN